MKYLAVDLGEKRTGLAIGDDRTRIVSPMAVLNVPRALDGGRTLIERISRAAAEAGAGALVVGLPLNMDDTEGPAAKSVRALAELLASRCKLPVHLQDERLTSFDADQAMARSGRTRGQKKQRRDALAAAAILRDFLGA
jgi:putative holliday junction resolvase